MPPVDARRLAVGLVPLGLVPALGGAQGGFLPTAWVWSGALAAWAAALALAIGAPAAALRRHWPWPAAGLALLLWTLCSALWSTEPGQSVLEARRTVVYVGAALAMLALARTAGAAVVVAATHAGISLLLLYALAHYLLVGRYANLFEGALLSEPLGYANAVGILAALGLLLAAAGLTSGRRLHGTAAAATLPPLALALTLSESKASWLALALGAGATLALRPVLWRHAALLGAVAVPTAALALLGHASALASATPRVGPHAVAAATIVCAAVAAALPRLVPEAELRPVRARWAVAAVAALVLAAAAVLVAAGAGSNEPRATYYSVAWRELQRRPALGTGAGTFGRYWLELGDPVRFGGALDAHSLYLETLAELGPLGLVLLAAFLAYPLRALGAARRPGPGAFAAGALVTFLVHAGLDWDWELPAVVVAALACGAALLLGDTAAADRPLPRPGRAVALALALALGGAALAGATSHAVPSAAPAGRQTPPKRLVVPVAAAVAVPLPVFAALAGRAAGAVGRRAGRRGARAAPGRMVVLRPRGL